MAYTTINKSTDYFNTKLYTGNGSTQNITGVGHQVDWTWIKHRTDTEGHALFDVLRGALDRVQTNSTNASSSQAGTVTAFGSDGFSLGNNAEVNANNGSYVSWNWKANGAGSANTDGSINTTATSANTTSGFSISTYTGTGANASIGTGLGAIPHMAIFKRTDTSGFNWFVYHRSLGAGKFIILDTTGAEQSSTSIWQNTTPTSSVITLGGDGGVNASGGTYIAYCFAEKKGFSKFGSYSSNNNVDGNFIYTGFSPAFVYIKQTNASGESSKMYDNKRLGYNVVANWLEADDNQAEGTGSNQIDILSNGFKLRATNTAINASGGSYIYMAFAEAPLVSSNGVPTPAR